MSRIILFWRNQAVLLVPVLLFLGCLAFLYLAGIRLNLTDSMPKGLYKFSSATSLKKFDYVEYCLTDSEFIKLAKEREYLSFGVCPGNLQPLLKEVYGLPGDILQVLPEGLQVNNQLIINSKYKSKDSQGRPMPPSKLTTGTIPAGYALILSNGHQGGFDSRYFGLAPIFDLKQVKPVFIF